MTNHDQYLLEETDDTELAGQQHVFTLDLASESKILNSHKQAAHLLAGPGLLTRAKPFRQCKSRDDSVHNDEIALCSSEGKFVKDCRRSHEYYTEPTVHSCRDTSRHNKERPQE